MTTEALPLRRATAADAADCARIVNDWIDATPWMPRLHAPEQIARFVAEGIARREVWVAGAPVVGYLSLCPEERQVMGLYVARPGNGVGKALMDRAKTGRDYLQLYTHEPNRGARRFYARQGFVEVGRDPDRSAEGVVEIRMEWHA